MWRVCNLCPMDCKWWDWKWFVFVKSFSAKYKFFALFRLAFTSNEVLVGVLIRSAEWYDLVKMKLTESEAEHRFRLWLLRLRSSANCIVRVASRSRSRRISQLQWLILFRAIGWFFRFCFRLRQPSFHWIISDGVVKGNRKKWKRSDSSNWSRRAYDSLYNSDFRFSLVISSITTMTTTPSLVKTSFYKVLLPQS